MIGISSHCFLCQSPGDLCRDCDGTVKRGYPGEKREDVLKKISKTPQAKREFMESNLAD